MYIEHFPVAPLGCNCVIVGDPERGEAIVCDPGGEADKIVAKLEAQGMCCVAIIHTHAHFDHCAATHLVQEATNAPTMLHEGDLFLYSDLQMQLDAFGMPLRAPKLPEVERFLKDADSVHAGDVEAGVLHTPGHTPGSLCFVIEGGEAPVLLAGDTLFRGSIGRTDLWGGDGRAILSSIEQKLLTLPDETLVVTGHGPVTRIGDEKRINPFFQ